MSKTVEAALIEELLDRLLRTPGEGVVQSVYRRSVNIEAQGVLFTVISPTPDRGPACAVLRRPVSFQGVEPGMRARWSDGMLTFGDISCLYAQATVCSCLYGPQTAVLPSAAATQRLLGALLHTASPTQTEGYGALIYQKLVRSGRELCAALRTGQDPGPAVERMVGFGLGLTPSGDDFLTGFYATLRVLGGPAAQGWAEAVGRAVRPCLNSTTQVGRWMLSCALEGRWRTSLQQVLLACADHTSQDLEQAVRELLAVGASSGFDMCMGVQRALALLNQNERSDENGRSDLCQKKFLL